MLSIPVKTNCLSTIQVSITEFLNDRQAQNLSKNTLSYYNFGLLEFDNYCNQWGVFQVIEITPDLIRAFLLHLQDKGHSSGGVHSYYRTIRAFLYFIENEYEPENWKNPIKKVKSPKVIVEPIEGVSMEYFQKLVDTCDSTVLGIRDKAILYTLLETGVRAQELLSINVGDIDFTDSSILIRQGKGRKPRSVFFGFTARKCLRKHLRNLPDKSPAFTTLEGLRLSYTGLRQVVRRLCKKAGIPEQSLHDFRRTFALESLKKGVDIFTISRLMGHTSLQVLSRYLRQTKGDLGESYKSIIDN
ncbi:MAG: site-specific integrase [Bellilinea sp.]